MAERKKRHTVPIGDERVATQLSSQDIENLGLMSTPLLGSIAGPDNVDRLRIVGKLQDESFNQAIKDQRLYRIIGNLFDELGDDFKSNYQKALAAKKIFVEDDDLRAQFIEDVGEKLKDGLFLHQVNHALGIRTANVNSAEKGDNKNYTKHLIFNTLENLQEYILSIPQQTSEELNAKVGIMLASCSSISSAAVNCTLQNAVATQREGRS